MKLYTFFRSSTSFRTRIALNLKGLDYEAVPVNIRIGEQHGEDYIALNPGHGVPTLIEDDGTVRVQTPAILEWLDETYAEPPFLPADPDGRYRVRALAAAVGADMHQLNNSRTLAYLADPLGHDEDTVAEWFNHWITLGLNQIETMLAGGRLAGGAAGRFCHGDSVTLADIYLVPQAFNARRFGLTHDAWPTIARIFETCMALDAFERAAPGNQPDAV